VQFATFWNKPDKKVDFLSYDADKKMTQRRRTGEGEEKEKIGHILALEVVNGSKKNCLLTGDTDKPHPIALKR